MHDVVHRLWANKNVRHRTMKIAVLFLLLGLVIGFVVPNYLREIFAGAEITLPRFFGSKPPPISFSVDVPVVLRVVGIILIVFAIVRFIQVRGGHAN